MNPNRFVGSGMYVTPNGRRVNPNLRRNNRHHMDPILHRLAREQSKGLREADLRSRTKAAATREEGLSLREAIQTIQSKND